MPSCGEAAVRLLERAGVQTVFGIPGVHTLELYRGLARSSIRHVATRHEQGAAFMADGWARVTGQPGVCILISGPGLTNALTPIAQAYHDSVPMLILSGAVADDEHGRGEIHDLPDQQRLMASVTAFSETIRAPGELPGAFARAWEVFASARPRPVHIAIPGDVLLAPADSVELTLPVPPARPLPPAAEVQRAATLLAGASRPLILLGGGARDAGREALALAERLDAPVGLTINARGTIPDTHPLCLGSALSFTPISDLIRDADATLLVGAELSDLDLWGLTAPLELVGLVRIDIDPAQLANRWVPEVGLHGDAAGTLGLLGDALAAAGEPAERSAGAPGAVEATRLDDPVRRGARDARAAPGRVAAARAGLRPPDEIGRFMPLLDALERVLPEDRIIAGDSTQPVYAANHLLPAHVPRSWLMPIGYGCLGAALPMAIGAKLAAPTRTVVALAGDGGFMFTLQELATARDLGVTLPVIVYNNGGYGEIRDSMDHEGIERLGTEAVHDFVAIAHAFGCAAVRVDALDAFEVELAGALEAPGPTVVELTWSP